MPYKIMLIIDFVCMSTKSYMLITFFVRCGLQMMNHFSQRHKLHQLEDGLYGLVCFRNF